MDDISKTNEHMEKIQAQIAQQQKTSRFVQTALNESCITKTIFSGVAGGGFGALWGAFTATIDPVSFSRPMIPGIANPGFDPDAKFNFREFGKQTGSRMWFMAKAFGGVGMLFTAYECSVEKYRAQHDLMNSVLAGCMAGGTVAVRAGPKAMALGCAGFAAFSALIDSIMQH